jgi:hypothetical protein
MKVRPVGVELFHANTQTDRQTERHVEDNKIAFRILGERLKLNKKQNQNKPINNTETDVEEQKHI